MKSVKKIISFIMAASMAASLVVLPMTVQAVVVKKILKGGNLK